MLTEKEFCIVTAGEAGSATFLLVCSSTLFFDSHRLSSFNYFFYLRHLQKTKQETPRPLVQISRTPKSSCLEKIMSLSLILALLFCFGIFFGSLEQARILMRRQSQKKTNDSSAAKRNSLHDELDALALGIRQVQGYIDTVQKAKKSVDSLAAAAQAQPLLDKAKRHRSEVEGILDQADSETAIKICDAKLDQARFYVRQARSLVEKLAEDEEDGGDTPDQE